MTDIVTYWHRHEGEKDQCIVCKEPIGFSFTIQDEWSHWHGDRWCHTKRGNFTRTPLSKAQPAFYPADAVL